MKGFKPIIVKLCIGTFFVLSPVAGLKAATINWDGDVSNEWSVTDNWGGGVLPGAADVATFPDITPTNLAPTIDLHEDFTVGGVLFNAATDAYNVIINGELTVTGSSDILNGGTVANQNITASGGTLNIENDNNVAGNNTGGTHNITLTAENKHGFINFHNSSTAGTNAYVVAQNKGVVNFLHNSAFQGASLSATNTGVINFADASNFVSGALSVNGSTLNFYDNASYDSASGSHSATNGSTVNFYDAATFAGTLTVDGSTINFFEQSKAVDETLTVQSGAIANFYNYSQLSDDATISANNATVNFRNDAQVLADASVNLTSSTANFSNWATFNGGSSVASTDSTFNFSDHSTFRAGQLDVVNRSDVIFYDRSQFTGGAINVDSTSGGSPSTVTFRDYSLLNGGDVSLANNGQAYFYGHSRYIAGTLNAATGSDIVFDDHSKADDVAIFLSASTVTFQDQAQLNDSYLDLKTGSTATFNLNGEFGEDSVVSLDQFGATTNTLAFNPSYDGTFLGEVVGNANGVVEKNGAGTLRLVTDSSDFLGTTYLNGGTTYLNTIWGGDVHVRSAKLRGEGTIEGDLVLEDNYGGILEPGNSPGTIRVLGDTSFGDDSTYIVQIDDLGNNSFLAVEGSLTISTDNTSLIVKSEDPAVLEGNNYLVAHANGGITGNFDNYDATNPLLSVIGNVTANDIFVNVSVPIASYVRNSNQYNVLEQLATNSDPSMDLNSVLSDLALLSGNEATQALDSLTGEQYANLVQVTQQSTRRFLNRLHIPGRLDRDCSCSDCFVWGEFQGGQSTFSNDNHIKGLDVDHYAFTFGSQKDIDENWATGAAFAYERDQLDFNLNGNGHGNTYQGAIYGVYSECCGYILGDLLLGYSEYDIHRKVHFGEGEDEVRRRIHGSTHIWDFTGNVEAGLNYSGGCFNIQPFLGFEAGTYRLNDFKEHDGDSLNLKFGKRNVNNFDGRIGAHLLMSLPCALQFGADIAYRHRFTSTRGRINAEFREFGDDFTIIGVNTGRDGVEWAAWLASDIGCNVDLYLETSGEHYEGLTDWSLAGGLVYRW